MPATPAVSVSDLLYPLCSVLLLGSAVLVLLRDPRSLLHRSYALTALSLLGWVATLGLFYRSSDPAAVLWLGRANFAAAALAVAAGYLLVRAIAAGNTGGTGGGGGVNGGGWQITGSGPALRIAVGETILLALASAFTPLIARDEIVGAGAMGRHLTVYGPLFPLYAAHVVGYLAACALVAFRARGGEAKGAVRDRLTLVGAGVLGTGAVGVLANIVLPYGFGEFRFTDWGPFSTALFLLAVGYAVLKHRLFDLRLFVRKTLVLGVLGSLALAAYGAVIMLATERFAGEGAGTLTRFAVLMIALSFDPLRRFMEKKVDRLLSRRH